MNALNELCASALSFFFDIGGHNYAVAIFLLTVLVNVLLLPMTIKGTRSMLVLQGLAPDIKRLQEEHKNDRERLNAEMMALYRDNKINPLGGCLPLLIRLPVFYVLYHVTMGLTHKDNGVPTPKYLDDSSALHRAIVNGNGRLESFGVDLASSVTKSLDISFVTAIPFILLILAMVAAQYWQQHQLTSRAPAPDNPQAEMMRKMQKIFPPFFGIVSISFPAAVVFYWATTSVLAIAQQSAMYRFDPVLKKTVVTAHNEAQRFLKKPKDSGRAQQRGSKPAKSKPSPSNKKKRKGR